MYSFYPAGLIRHKIRYLVLLLATVFICAGLVHAQDGHNQKPKRNFIWSVESGSNTVYLLGSIHVLKQESYPLPAEVERIFDCCEKIAFETDLDGMNDPASQQRMLRQGLYSSGQTLSENISPETYSLLNKRLEAEGLSIGQFDTLRPWLIAMTIAGTELKRLGFDPDLGLDRYFYQKAKKAGKEMIFLETNEMQLNLMTSLNRRHQEAFLKGVLRELDIVESLASDMLGAWKTGDTEKLDTILKMSHAEEPDIYDRFFIQRNKRWISTIQKLLKQDGDVLIIVGAGHLAGKDSVIDLLKKKGYKVQQR